MSRMRIFILCYLWIYDAAIKKLFPIYALCPKQFLNSRIVNSTTNMPASPTPSFPIFPLFHLSTTKCFLFDFA